MGNWPQTILTKVLALGHRSSASKEPSTRPQGMAAEKEARRSCMVTYGSETVLGPPPHNVFQLKDPSAKKTGGSLKSRIGVCCSLFILMSRTVSTMIITIMNERPTLQMKERG